MVCFGFNKMGLRRPCGFKVFSKVGWVFFNIRTIIRNNERVSRGIVRETRFKGRNSILYDNKSDYLKGDAFSNREPFIRSKKFNRHEA